MKRYNVKGKDNPLCWLLGALYCCALYQHRTFLLAQHDKVDSASGRLLGAAKRAVTSQPEAAAEAAKAAGKATAAADKTKADS